jgi:hypothetical protein
MRVIRVNADYEVSLFHQRQAPQIINHSLEFLAFYLDERPLLTQKQYTQSYLSHVEQVTGRRPIMVDKAPDVQNWWGALQNLPLERELNSKIFTAKMNDDSFIISQIHELNLADGKYLAKDPFGMSGRGIVPFLKGEESKIFPLLEKTGSLIIEPLFERVYDFSHYVLLNGDMIAYENLVDSSFQYKGTFFREKDFPIRQRFSFFEQIQKSEWDLFDEKLHSIIATLRGRGVEGGYSIDSFVYRDADKLKIRALCEINYRKTMGLIAWELSQRYGLRWNLFLLGKALKEKDAFQSVQEKISGLNRCLHLSPGDTRFEMFLISAENETLGMGGAKKLKELLPDCEFAIEI